MAKNEEKPNLKVFMMGGRRCGKTSALASLFHQAINGEMNKVFTITNKPKYQEKDGEKIEPLENKRLELVNFINKGGNNIFLADKAPTNHYWDYFLKVQIPGTDRSMIIQFRDSAGEVFEPDSEHYEEALDYVKQSDVFIVVVDTPYLMAGDDVESEAANIKDNLHTFLTNMNRGKAVQVIFVPIKCEKWVKKSGVDSVTEAVKKLYAATFKDLEVTEKIEISIIPIETAGDIIFEELRESFLLYNIVTKTYQKCSLDKNDDNIVILRDGKPHKKKDYEIVNEDMEAKFHGTEIHRRSAWYSLRHEPKASYTPHNCEQLVTHILRFMFNKFKQENERWWIIGDIWRFFFGGIDPKEMEVALNKLSDSGLIKNNGDGIVILKSCFLPNKRAE